jgi:hypothetical protein
MAVYIFFYSLFIIIDPQQSLFRCIYSRACFAAGNNH